MRPPRALAYDGVTDAERERETEGGMSLVGWRDALGSPPTPLSAMPLGTGPAATGPFQIPVIARWRRVRDILMVPLNGLVSTVC